MPRWKVEHVCGLVTLLSCGTLAFGALACGDAGGAPQHDAAAGAGAGAGMSAPTTGMPACDPYTTVFPLVCGTSICHEGTINGLDLIAPGVDERVLDAPASGVNCAGSGLRIVDSAQPERSLLLLKLSEQPPCGSPMPLGSGPAGLSADQRACLDAYVASLTGR